MTALCIDYADHKEVDKLIERIRDCIEGLSIDFGEWDDEFAKGPGLYVAVVADRDYDSYADPMGTNRWPVEDCRAVPEETFYDALERVAFGSDGAVVVSVDGVVQEQMVRLRDVRDEYSESSDIEYEDWMGSRHMSALETSVRPAVVATLTLSEENGRVSVFRDGDVETVLHRELGTPWRKVEE